MELNWDRCVICQQEAGEPLKYPLLSPGSSRDNTDAYTSFLTNVEQFRAFGALPAEQYFGSDETVANFASHSASWHKSCHLKFKNSKLAKAKRKRERNNDEEKRPRNRKALDVQKCSFCEKGEEEHVLHEVSSFDEDKNIREIITELNDTQLLSRIVGGDLIAMEAKYNLKCMVKLRNRYRSLTRKLNQIPEDTDAKMNEFRAFEEPPDTLRNL